MVQRSLAALSHLKFRHIALIQYLLQEGTLRKAARRLSISQPAATAMLSDIENLLGVQLFTRSRQGVAPTAQTLALAPRLRILMNDFDELGAMLDRLDTGEHEVLRVGVVPQAFTVRCREPSRAFVRPAAVICIRWKAARKTCWRGCWPANWIACWGACRRTWPSWAATSPR